MWQREMKANCSIDEVYTEALEKGMVWPSLAVGILDHLEGLFKRKKIEDPRKLAELALLELSLYGGGRDFYVPQGEKIKKAIRDNQIYTRRPHTKVKELAEEFRMTERAIWRVVKQQHELRRKNRLPIHDK